MQSGTKYVRAANAVSRRGRRSHGTRCGLSPGAIATTSEPDVVEPAGKDERGHDGRDVVAYHVDSDVCTRRCRVTVAHCIVCCVLCYTHTLFLSLHQIRIQTF